MKKLFLALLLAALPVCARAQAFMPALFTSLVPTETTSSSSPSIDFSNLNPVVGSINGGPCTTFPCVFTFDQANITRGSVMVADNTSGWNDLPMGTKYQFLGSDGTDTIFTNVLDNSALTNAAPSSTASSNGLTLQNSTAALVGAQTQYSPRLYFVGHHWNTGGSADNKDEFWLGLENGGGNPGTANFAINRQTNGGGVTTVLQTSGAGGLDLANSGTGYRISSRSRLTSPSDGNWTLGNNAGSDFTMLQWGGTTSSFPGIKKNASNQFALRLADDSAYAGAYGDSWVSQQDNVTNTAYSSSTGPGSNNGITLRNTTAATSGAQIQYSPRIYFEGHHWNTGGTPADNKDEFWMGLENGGGNPGTANWALSRQTNGGGVTTVLSTNGTGGLDLANSGSGYRISGRSRFTSPSDGVWTLGNNAGSDFTRLGFGGTTSSFPAISKVAATQLAVKLADDSAFAGLVADNVVNQTANGALWTRGSASEQLTLSTSGTTTDTAANLLPAGAVIEGVVVRITTTITTATNYSVGDPTTAARFCASSSTLTSGSTQVCIAHRDPTATAAAGPQQSAAAKVRITTTGTPGAGVIRITVFYSQFTAPTS